MDNETKTKNTDELFRHLAQGFAHAEKQPEGILRSVALESAKNAEWHTLFAILLIGAMRDIYDTQRVAERVDVLMKKVMAPRNEKPADA